MRKPPVELLDDQEVDKRLSEALDRAVSCLKDGGIVAFPTETSYGLVLIGEMGQLGKLAESIPDLYYPLMRDFWPGPLTLIFPGRKNLPPLLTGGTGTIGVRISSNAIAAELCRRWGRPLTATSANISGSPPATCAADVKVFFGSKVDCLVDGGSTPAGPCSTIVGIRRNSLQLFREGRVDFPSILQAL